jgi:hypothetical protein
MFILQIVDVGLHLRFCLDFIRISHCVSQFFGDALSLLRKCRLDFVEIIAAGSFHQVFIMQRQVVNKVGCRCGGILFSRAGINGNFLAA